ncbi:putative NADH oxidase [Rhizoctonia solani]|nr:putative NADH oxidase [Rhizoctonia solani]
MASLFNVSQRYGPATSSLEDAKLLGEAIKFEFSGRTMVSRIYKAATGEQMYSWDPLDPSARGTPLGRLVQLYETWGQGRYGMIITGDSTVDSMHLETPGSGVVAESNSTPTHIEQLRRLASAGSAHGSLVVMQLSHAGRRTPGYINSQPVSAGDGGYYIRPAHSTDKGRNNSSGGSFVYAAGIAHRAGFDGIQLHSVYDSLLSQFLSTRTNNRSDDYGGNIDNRSRIICEIIDSIRKEVKDPQFIIGIKIYLSDFKDKIGDARHFCQKLQGLSLDFIEVVGGGFDPPESQEHSITPLKEFVQQISPLLSKTLLFVSGGFRSSDNMARAIRDGHCTCVGLGQPCGSDPLLPSQIIGRQFGGAIKPDPNLDAAAVKSATGTHMEAIARGMAPIDLSNPQVSQEFSIRIKKFEEERQEALKQGNVKVGYMVWDETKG